MSFKHTSFWVRNFPKFITGLLFMVLLFSYIRIFAIASPYSPGTTLDPACIPNEINCVVSSPTASSLDIGITSTSIIYKGVNPFIFDFNYGNNGVVTTEGHNTFLGINTGNLTMGSTATATYEASYNTGLGGLVLNLNTKGYNNTAVGSYSLTANTTGNYNSVFGIGSLRYNTTGNFNTGSGAPVLGKNVTGQWNSTIGAYTAYYNISGSSNVALGYYGLLRNTTGVENLSISPNAFPKSTTGSGNIGIGDRVFFINTTGNGNSSIGWRSFYNLFQTSKAISAFSDYSGTVPGTVKATSASHGLAGSSTKTITGTDNYNGTYTITVIDGSNFYFTHAFAGTEINGWWGIETQANYNVGMGIQVGYNLTTGSSNIFIGPFSGNNASQLVSANNSIGIGSGTYTTASNQAIYGNSSMTQHLFQAGNVGIGDLSPASLLTVGNGDLFQVNSLGAITSAGGITSSGTITFSNILSCGGVLTNGSGVLACTSDESLKDIKNNFTRGLDAIEQINPISFSWKEGTYLYDNGITYNGFSAQNVQSVLPEAISTSSDGYLQVSQLTLLATAINAIKELDLKVKNISSENLSNPLSIGSLIKQFLANVSNNIEDIFTKVFHSEELCTKNTCINEEQLIQILNKAGVNPTTNN